MRGDARPPDLAVRRPHRRGRHRHRDLPHDAAGGRERAHRLRRPLSPSTSARLVLAALALGAAACEDLARAPALVFPDRLSETGLFAELRTRALAPGAIAFAPRHTLWSDGADKQRWLSLPPGGVIDGSDPDHWVFPIGTRFWKSFSRGGRILETRLILRIGDTGVAERDYLAGAYLWRDDESDADFVIDGADDVRGTSHDVPSRASCWRCHIGEPGHILGFSALQLAEAGEGSAAGLAARGLLAGPQSSDPSGSIGLAGDETAAAAQGWLHANCGHCHNPNGNAWPQTKLVLRLSVDEHDPRATALYQSNVGVPLDYYHSPTYTTRIVPGDPDRSALWFRDGVRGTMDQMPPLATEVPDPVGLAQVRRWISELR